LGLHHLLLGVEVAALDPLGEVDLLLRGEQADLADVLKERLEAVEDDVGRECGRLAGGRARLFALALVIEDLLTKIDALVADIDPRPGDQLLDLVLALPAETALQLSHSDDLSVRKLTRPTTPTRPELRVAAVARPMVLAKPAGRFLGILASSEVGT